jgi:hypothetical protein
MPTNPDGQLAPNQVAGTDRTLLAISTITRNVSIAIVVLALIAYCWHFGIVVDINKIVGIFDRLV